MQMVKTLGLLLASVMLIAGVYYFRQQSQKPAQEIHYHAGYEVYKDGALQDFSDLKYMDMEPCVEGEKEEEEKEEHDLDLHDGIGNIAHVHGEGVTWRKLFEYLRQDYPDASVTAYMNGVKLDQVLDKKMDAYDRGVFFVGEDSEQQKHIDESMQRITKDYIVRIEKKGESCTK